MKQVRAYRPIVVMASVCVGALLAASGCASGQAGRGSPAATPAVAAPAPTAVAAARSAWPFEPDRPAPAGFAWETAKTWELAKPASGDGKWPKPEEVDTSAYASTAADGKGTVTANGEGFPKEGAACAFDGDSGTKYCIKTTTMWVQYQYANGAKHKVTAYAITSANDAPERDPKDWKLLGSNDGKAWETVDEQKNQSFLARFFKRLYPVKKPGEFGFYKLDVTANHDSETCQIGDLELFEPKAAK